ncbi:hypothetical protein HY624_04035 [Candidatus Uhrbacteria bacterium]|nr:hypothetical protein [Candidatus Uhrbacteria bacterium]
MANLPNRTKRLNTLIGKAKDKETKSSLRDAVGDIADKTRAFAKDGADANFPEAVTQCRGYVQGLDDDIRFYLRTGKFNP